MSNLHVQLCQVSNPLSLSDCRLQPLHFKPGISYMLSMTFCNNIEQFMSIKYYLGLIRTSHKCMLSNNIMVSIVHIKKQTNKHDITMVLFHKQTN